MSGTSRGYHVPLALCLVGCKDSVAPRQGLDDNDVKEVVDFIVGGQPVMPAGSASGASIGSAAVVVAQQALASIAFDISNTLQCPAGGTTVVSGSGDRAPNQSTRITTVTWNA